MGGIGADHDHRDVPGCAIGLKVQEDILTRHIRQVEIEQNEIGEMFASQVQAGPSEQSG
jgi:hypothetical protein